MWSPWLKYNCHMNLEYFLSLLWNCSPQNQCCYAPGLTPCFFLFPATPPSPSTLYFFSTLHSLSLFSLPFSFVVFLSSLPLLFHFFFQCIFSSWIPLPPWFFPHLWDSQRGMISSKMWVIKEQMLSTSGVYSGIIKEYMITEQYKCKFKMIKCILEFCLWHQLTSTSHETEICIISFSRTAISTLFVA